MLCLLVAVEVAKFFGGEALLSAKTHGLLSVSVVDTFLYIHTAAASAFLPLVQTPIHHNPHHLLSPFSKLSSSFSPPLRCDLAKSHPPLSLFLLVFLQGGGLVFHRTWMRVSWGHTYSARVQENT